MARHGWLGVIHWLGESSKTKTIPPAAATTTMLTHADLKLKEWNKANNDCTEVLHKEPGNVKGLTIQKF